MKAPFWRTDPYAKEKRLVTFFGWILLLVLLLCLIVPWVMAP